MTKSDVIKFFGSKTKAASALGIKKQSVGQWGEEIPFLRQCHIQVASNGQLKAVRKTVATA